MSISCSPTMGMEALGVSFFGRVLPIPPYLVMNWGVCRVVDLGQKVPKFVLNESRGHVDSRSGICLMERDGWWEILMAKKIYPVE